MIVHMHFQCELRRPTEQGFLQQTVWLPAEHAVKDKFVKLKTNGTWEDGWLVEQVFQPPLPSEVIQERSRDFKNHRKATDV